MLANNRKISDHQITRLLFGDLIARLMLLLPYAKAGASGWEFLAATGLGILWTLLYVRLLAGFSGYVQGSFTAYLRERAGAGVAYAVDLLMIMFLLLHLAYLVRLTGTVCRIFLLPETRENVLLICTLLAGTVTAAGDGQVRGRMAEIFFLPVAAALAIMLLASAGAVKPEHFYDSSASFNVMEIFIRSGAVFGSFCEVTLILYDLPHIRCRSCGQRRALQRAMQKGILVTAAFLLVVFGIALGVFGEAGFLRLPWPALTLMSSASLPGGFLQRWDVVFLAFLLPGLFLATGSAFHHLGQIWREIFPKSSHIRVLAGMCTAALLLSLLSGDYENAMQMYFKWGICTLVPLMAAVPVFLGILERMKKKCGS